MASAYDNWLEGDCGVDDAEEARRERVAERRDELVAERMANPEAVGAAIGEWIGEEYSDVFELLLGNFVTQFDAANTDADMAAVGANLWRSLRQVAKARIHDEAERMAESEEFDRECAAERDHGEYLAERGVAV